MIPIEMMTNDIWEPIRLGQVYVGLRHMRAGKLRPASRSAGATLSVSLLIVRTVHSNDATSSHTLDESISALQRYSISTTVVNHSIRQALGQGTAVTKFRFRHTW